MANHHFPPWIQQEVAEREQSDGSEQVDPTWPENYTKDFMEGVCVLELLQPGWSPHHVLEGFTETKTRLSG